MSQRLSDEIVHCDCGHVYGNTSPRVTYCKTMLLLLLPLNRSCCLECRSPYNIIYNILLSIASGSPFGVIGDLQASFLLVCSANN